VVHRHATAIIVKRELAFLRAKVVADVSYDDSIVCTLYVCRRWLTKQPCSSTHVHVYDSRNCTSFDGHHHNRVENPFQRSRLTCHLLAKQKQGGARIASSTLGLSSSAQLCCCYCRSSPTSRLQNPSHFTQHGSGEKVLRRNASFQSNPRSSPETYITSTLLHTQLST
jgi:hypothetical protein